MTELEAIEAIYQQWETAWEILHPGSKQPIDTGEALCAPWTTRNEAYEPSTLGALGAWARVSVIHTTAEQTTMGSAPNRKFDRRGNVFVQLFAPINAGVALLAELAGDVRTVLEGQRLGALLLYAARTEEGDEEGAWATCTVVIPFRYTDTR